VSGRDAINTMALILTANDLIYLPEERGGMFRWGVTHL